jgi:hypothetical protein
MGDFTATIIIDQPADTVFAFLADPPNLPLWLEAVDHVAFDDTPPRRGDRFLSAEGLAGTIAHLDGVATRLFKRGMQRNLRTLERLLTTGVAANTRHSSQS